MPYSKRAADKGRPRRHLSGERCEHRLSGPARPLPTRTMTTAIASALAEAAPEDRDELSRWTWRRMIVAFAHEQGLRAAAAEAYAVADALAGAIQ